MRRVERSTVRRCIRTLEGLLAGIAASCAMLVPFAARAADTCTPAAVTHAFGAYDTLNPRSGTSTITVTCTVKDTKGYTVPYTIALSSGSGSYAGRQMTGTGDTLTYNLYTSAGYTTVWGNGTSGTSTVSGSVVVPKGVDTYWDTVTVYGLIGAPQNVTPGNYSTLTPVTVTLTGGYFPTTTTTFNANASVAAQCNLSAGNLGFGAVNPLSSQTDATTTITVNCTKNSPYTIGLNAGVTAGATIAQRLMANGTETMLYNLYTDSTRLLIWGNSPGSWVTGAGAGLAIAQARTVFGRVAGGQLNLAVGNYQENTITVTTTY